MSNAVQSEATKEFLKKLKASGHWNDEYDYSRVEYVRNSEKVLVVHREFGTEHMISPSVLLRSGGLEPRFVPWS